MLEEGGYLTNESGKLRFNAYPMPNATFCEAPSLSQTIRWVERRKKSSLNGVSLSQESQV